PNYKVQRSNRGFLDRKSLNTESSSARNRRDVMVNDSRRAVGAAKPDPRLSPSLSPSPSPSISASPRPTPSPSESSKSKTSDKKSGMDSKNQIDPNKTSGATTPKIH